MKLIAAIGTSIALLAFIAASLPAEAASGVTSCESIRKSPVLFLTIDGSHISPRHSLYVSVGDIRTAQYEYKLSPFSRDDGSGTGADSYFLTGQGHSAFKGGHRRMCNKASVNNCCFNATLSLPSTGTLTFKCEELCQ